MAVPKYICKKGVNYKKIFKLIHNPADPRRRPVNSNSKISQVTFVAIVLKV
jgi:hypothetical protein